MMCKLITQSSNQGNPLSLKSIKEKGKVKEGIIFMTEIGSKGEIG